MSWIAASIIGGSVISSVIGGNAAQNAASTQANAANNASATQLQMFNQTQQNLQPFMQEGQGAVSQLMKGTQPGGSLMPASYTPYQAPSFQGSPEYQNMMLAQQQAINASQNASSISGGENSNNLKGLLNWSQQNANQGYGQYLSDQTTNLNNYINQFLTGNNATTQQFNTLNTVAGNSQNAAAGLGALSTQVGQQIGNNMIGAGNAQAAGQIGVANAITGGLTGGYNAYVQQQYLNALGGGGAGGGGSGVFNPINTYSNPAPAVSDTAYAPANYSLYQ